MFEKQASNLLNKIVGQYVEGLDNKALRLSVWSGDVELNKVQLKADALNA